MNRRSYIGSHRGHPHDVSDSKLGNLRKLTTISAEQEQRIALIRHLADPTKLKIYKLLYHADELPVSDIARVLSISPSAASHALSDLKSIHIVRARRCGQLICYSLETGKNYKKLFNTINTLIFL